MAVSLIGSWSSATDGVDPSGSVTPESGTNRVFIYVVGTAQDGYGINEFTLGGSSADWQFSFNATSADPNDLNLFYYVWGEDTIAALTSTGISFDDGVASPARFTHMYATYASVEQSAPGVAAVFAFEDSVTVPTSSESGDRIIVSVIRDSNNRDTTDWDTLSEIDDHAPTSATGMRFGLGEGNGGDGNTTVVGDGFSVDTALYSLVLPAFTVGASVSGAGSADGIIATISGAGERVITSQSTLETVISEVSGVGERTITGAGSADGIISQVEGAGLGIVLGQGSLSGYISQIQSFPESDLVYPIARKTNFNFDDVFAEVTLHEDPSNQKILATDHFSVAVIVEDQFLTSVVIAPNAR